MVLAPVLALIHFQGIPIVGYLDDLLQKKQLVQTLQKSALPLTHFLKYLVFIFGYGPDHSLSLGQTPFSFLQHSDPIVQGPSNHFILHEGSGTNDSLLRE